MTRPCPHDPAYASPLSCVECMAIGNLPPVPPAPPVEAERHGIVARFSGQCHECNLGIHVGQRVTRMTDGTWLHDECAP